MSINTTLAGLSTNPALNGPDGAADLPSQLDDALRYHGAFIAQLRDGVGFTAGAVVAGLGFTPVQQGTGTSQLPNTVKIGWSATTQLRLQVDATDYGVNWPINITGNAATATAATTATTASNSNALGGASAIEYVKRLTSNTLALAWDSGNGQVVGYVDGTPQPTYTTWAKVSGRPTALSSFTNDVGYMVDADVIRRAGAVTNLGNSGSTTLTCNLSGVGSVSWTVAVSDARLKENIRPTMQDSLAKVRRLSFKSFNFQPGHDDGHEHKAGLIAQDIEEIDAELVESGFTWKQPRVWEMLCLALHAVQQLEARVAALEGRA